MEHPTVLALDTGVRETGWALFAPGLPAMTGVINVSGRRGTKAEARVRQLMQSLDRLVVRWQPEGVAHSQPSGIHWRVPALELLEGELHTWCQQRGLTLHSYTAQEVRAAIAGHSNVTQDRLAYAVMVKLGLIGQSKTTHEWEALAVGHYHLSLGTKDW